MSLIMFIPIRFWVAYATLSTLLFLALPLTTAPFLAPNPTYSSAGTYIFNTGSAFGSNTSLVLPFTITFTRAHTTSTYAFGYSIKQINYVITSNKVNHTVESGTKTATSVAMNFYTSNANQISSLSIAYVIIEPLFGLNDFVSCWIKPNSNINNSQYFEQTVSGVGPFALNTQNIWTTIVGVDASLSGNNQYDLYALASLSTTSSILFRISTISPTQFYLTSVIIEAFVYNATLLQGSPRSARFSSAEINNLNSYTNSAMQSYNTIYGVRTYHPYNQNFLIYQWTLSSSTLTVTSSNTFSWVGFNYLILQFITCSPTTPYLLISNNICYDIVPPRYYADGYNQCQPCPYDCYACLSNGSCTSCSNSSDFRMLNTSTSRCIPISGYYESGVTVALPCNSSACLTCSSLTFCLSCSSATYLSASNTCLPCISNCLNCTAATNCQLCSTNRVFTNMSCIVDCSSITNCSTCSLSNETVVCLSCTYGYNVTSNTCAQLCGNGIQTQSEQCDDGNIGDGDGCSSTCTVQLGFYCVYSNASYPSSTCNQCSSNCTNCINSTVCTNCTVDYQIVNATCLNITANTTNTTNLTSNSTNSTTNSTNSTTNSTTNTTTNSTTNATNSTNSTTNSTSNSTTNSTTNSTSNSTTNSTSPTNATNSTTNSSTNVSSTCGNGIIQASQSCDDANNMPNDGCSTDCQTQPYFACTSSPSICNINAFTPTLISLAKNPSANQFTITYWLQPSSVQSYSTLNWSSVVVQTSNLGVTLSAARFDQGKLSLTYDYSQNMNQNNLALSINFPNSAPFTNIQNVTVQSSLTQQDSNLSLQAYSDSTYQSSSIIYSISFALAAVALLMFLIGFWKGKIISLQLITIFQIAYLSLATLTKLSPTLSALRGLSLSLGYNINLMQSNSANNRLAALNIKLLFFDNYNISFLFVLLPLLASFIFSLIARAKSEEVDSWMNVQSRKLRSEWAFYALMFSLYICVVSAGSAVFMFSSLKMAQLVGVVVAAVLIICAYCIGSKVITQGQDMGEFIANFEKEKWVASNYYFILIIQRCITGVVFLLPIFSKPTAIIVAILVIQIMLVALMKPYKMPGYQLRPLLNLSISLLIVAIYILLPILSLSVLNIYAPYIILGLLALSICYNIYYLLKECLMKKNQNQLSKDDESKILNSQRLKLQLNSSFLLDSQILKVKEGDNRREANVDQLNMSAVKEQLNRIKQTKQDDIFCNNNFSLDLYHDIQAI